MSDFVKGYGVKIGHAAQGTDGAIGSGPFTYFARVTEIGGIEVESDDIETSHMESPNQFKEFTAGWADAGEVEFTIQFRKANAAEVWGLFRQDKSFEVKFKDGSAWTFNGYLKKFGTEADREGIVTVPVTVKISGEPDLAVAA
jgi:hypothetical protein